MDKFLIPFSIILAGIIIAGAVLVSGSNFSWPGMMGFYSAKKTDSTSANPPPVQSSPVPLLPKPIKIELGSNPIQGSGSAKVAVVEFGDYQCPFCGQFHAVVLPQLIKDFVSKGLVKFAYRDFIVIDSFIPNGHESRDAALAARCANDQGKFWAYHDKLYENQKGENQEAFILVNLKKFAAQLGLNAGKFNTCLTQRTHDAEVRTDGQAAQSYSVNSTPTVFINSQPVVSWQNYEGVKAQIEAALR